MSNVEKFNKIFDEFLTKLINHFKNDKLSSYYRGFKMIKVIDVELPSMIFMSSCFHLKDKIKKRDADFFINDKDILNTSRNYGNFSDQLDLKKHWDKIPDDTKKSIWDYIQTLFVLGEFIIIDKEDKFKSFLKNNSDDYREEIKDIQGGKFSNEFIKKLKQ
tara:strand:+ start:26 stop:508 length:483 start_codon:yes stop_codon:yes gene_type:complete